LPTDLKIFLACDRSTGEIKNATQVPNGKDCNCDCIHCGQPLQSRQGEHNRHHFSHISSANCSPETILHELAKKILLEHNKVMLPENKGWFEYTQVRDEVILGNQKPDIVVVGVAGRLHIEVAVTSFIDDTKLAKIELGRYNTMEIDLSHLAYDTSYDQLKKVIIDEIENKELIFWKDPELPKHNDDKTAGWVIGILLFIGAFWGIRKFRKWLKRK
jgi:hypothetical protein